MIREERKRKAHNFIEVHEEDLGGESVASSSRAFDCSHHLPDCLFGHRFVARRFLHLVFVAWCLYVEPRFASMLTDYFFHHGVYRHHSDGALHRGASLHLPPQQYCAPHVPVGHHQQTANFLPPRC